MNIQQVYHNAMSLEDGTIYDLYAHRYISVQFKEPEHATCYPDACLVGHYGNFGVMLNKKKFKTIAEVEYKMWHELGHIETYGLALDPESYDARTKNKQREIECNMFAFFGMFYTNRRLINSAGSKYLGMPEDDLEKVITILSQDEEFMKYLNVK